MADTGGYCGIAIGTGGTFSIVENQINALTEYANDAVTIAQDTLAQLAQFSVDFTVPSMTFQLTSNNVAPFQAAAKPTAPSAVIATPAVVSDPSLKEIAEVSLGTTPVFTATEPVVTLPPRPGSLSAIPPGSAPTMTNVTLPTEPSDVIPDLPSLTSYQLPVIAPLNLAGLRSAFDLLWEGRPADFTGALGDNYLSSFNSLWPALLAKQADYIGSNTVNSRVISVIEDFLSGAIGVPSSVDTQLWGRDYAELDRNVQRAEREARENWSARGETMVGGVLDFRLAYARQEAVRARQNVVRERMIKRNEWLIENYARALQRGIGFLEMERKQWLAVNQFAEQMAARAFDVASKVAEFAMRVRQLAQSYWKEQAGVFDTWLRTELAELERVKMELDSQRLISDINKDLLAQYNQRLEGIKIKFSLYKDKIEALNLIVAQDKIRFDGFESLVKAYTAEVSAWGEEWNGYSKAVDGELGRARVYETMAQAFAERMKGYSIEQDTKRSNEQLKIETNRLAIDLFGRKIDRFLGELRAEETRVNALVNLFQTQGQLYASENNAQEGRIRSEVQALEFDTKQREVNANLELRRAEFSIQEMLSIKELMLKAMEAIARTEATLAGSAMSAAHVGATISSGTNDSKSCSTNYSVKIEG